jgi:hypothetical protein
VAILTEVDSRSGKRATLRTYNEKIAVLWIEPQKAQKAQNEAIDHRWDAISRSSFVDGGARA